jgi:hypothetical protein
MSSEGGNPQQNNPIIKSKMEPEQIRILREKGQLWDRVVDEIGKKHIGDVSAREIILISCIGRLIKNKKPYSFNLLVHSCSSAGKDHIVESVLSLFPKEDIEAFGRISKTALTYLHDKRREPLWTYDGKILYLEEITSEILNNEIMKVFTAGITKSAITKDQRADITEVKGKPIVICTTATTKPTPEILNRFSIVKLDESEEQTKRTFILDEEEYDAGIINYLVKLKPQLVNISDTMKKKIGRIFPASKTRMRREFQRFLDIVRAVAIFNKGKEIEGEINADWKDYDLAVRIFSNYRSGISAIPLKNEDKKIIEVLEKAGTLLSVREIVQGTEGILSISNIYKHLDNLTENEILECFDQRDAFNNPVKKYQVSEEMQDKNPIQLPLSADIS